MTKKRCQEAEQVWNKIRHAFSRNEEIQAIAAALAKARNDAREEAAKKAEKWKYGYNAARHIRALKEE